MKNLSTLIKKIEQRLRKNPRSVPLLDMEFMILVITCMIMKTLKSLGVEMWYSMRRSCIKTSYRERNEKMKTQNKQCLMELKKMKFQRHQKIKMINKNNKNKYLKLLQVLLENLPG